MQEAAAAEPAEAEAATAADTPLDGDGLAKVLASTPTTWTKSEPERTKATMDKLNQLQADFDPSSDPLVIKEKLLGSWKLLVTGEDDETLKVGMSGYAAKGYNTVIGHYQTFRKPDPMDIFNIGGITPLLETVEVITNKKEGTVAAATIKGGFQVATISNDELGCVEMYTKKEFGGQGEVEATFTPKRWQVAYISDTLRICKLLDGSTRVYAKVDESAIADDVKRLTGAEVEIDPDAYLEDEVPESEDEEEEDPDDDRPMWQKRIDKADGVKRTKNGTPILTDRHS